MFAVNYTNACIPKVYSILLTVTEIWPRPTLTDLSVFDISFLGNKYLHYIIMMHSYL